MWVAKVKESWGDALQVDWRPFLLAQVNSDEAPEWKVWEHTEDSTGLNVLAAMISGQAAQRQGSHAFEAFLLALLKARHEDRKDLADQGVIMEIARASGMDIARFQEDLADESILQELGRSHTQAAEEHGVFGVPTFVFPNGASAFLKCYKPPDEEAVESFESLNRVMGKLKYVGEIKRPQPTMAQRSICLRASL